MKLTRVFLPSVLIALAIGLPVFAQDVGFYNIQYAATYDQNSTNDPQPDPDEPYQFYTQVSSGSSGTLLPTTTLSLSPGSNANVIYQAGANGLQFTQDFTTLSNLQGAFQLGNYTLNIQTSTPNSYNVPITLSDGEFPPVPTITGLTNATWGANGCLIVTNVTQPDEFNKVASSRILARRY